MEKRDKWSEHCAVPFSSIDASGTMTASAIFHFFQEAAIAHAENLGVGREAMAHENQLWILSRMSVQVDQRPLYENTITVNTWPRGAQKLVVLRDYDIRDALGVPMVRARSNWIIIDQEKRRPLRPQTLMETMPLNEGSDALPTALGLEERKVLQKKMERRAMYNDIDYNGHVNNVSYIRWIEDALDPLLLQNAKRMRLDINYLGEIAYNTNVSIWMANIDEADADAFAFEGRKEPDNQAAFRAELRLWH